MPPPLTKIIATLGPASSDAACVRKLLEAGVSIFRLNLSHGEPHDHSDRVRIVRESAAQLGRPTAILGDLQGPKIRVGKVVEGGISVAVGQTVLFRCQGTVAQWPTAGAPPVFSCTYPGLIDDVQPGERLFVNDGAVRMLITAKRKASAEVECVVTIGGDGIITSGKGMNLPDSHLRIDSITGRDRTYVAWAIEHDLDFLALSFVRSAQDLQELRATIDAELQRAAASTSAGVPALIAKIELPSAVANIESIIDVADGIMIARGDLGVEMDLAQVPVIQKQLLNVADRYGKPCIVATQMLESMVLNPIPTRAEASDIANAILDGADALMLSGETAVGKYPVLAVEKMRRIAQFTEEYLATLPPRPSPPQKLVESRYRTAALAHGVWTISQDIAAKFIVVWSQQGGGARYLSQNNFNVPIVAVTSDEHAARRMQLLRGVTPLVMPRPEGLAHFTKLIDEYLLETDWAKPGDPCILVAGGPIGTQGVTNSLAIHAIGDPHSGFVRDR